MNKQPSKNRKTPQGEERNIVNEPKSEDLAVTLTEKNEAVLYDTSQPVFMMTRKMSGRVQIPLYEEVPKVTGYFKNMEHPGQPLTIPHRAWKGPIRYFTLVENKLLSIPVTLCDLLNNGACYVEKKWVTTDGQSISRPILSAGGSFVNPDLSKEIKKKTHRFSFTVQHNVQWSPKIENQKNEPVRIS